MTNGQGNASVNVFGDADWWSGVKETLGQDARWLEAVKYFEAGVELRTPDASGYLDIRNGTVAAAAPGAPVGGPDIIIAAPADEWAKLLNGETDWFQGMSPGIGQFTIEAGAVAALRNVKAMWLTFEALKRAAGHTPKRPAPSPEPTPSGKPTIGRYIQIDGIRTYYEEAGEGPAIVCLHAACQDTLMYRHILDDLSDKYRVISIDAPGHCKSLEPEGGMFESLTRHAEFNEMLMDALDLERPVLIGCSMSGNQVLELAARRPDHYAAIVSSEGADFTPTVSQFLLDMLLLNGQQIVECWSQSLTGDRTPPDRARETIWQIRRAVPEAMRGDLVGYASFDKREAVAAIRSPVLMLRGDADWLVSQEQTESTASRIPNSQIAVLAGTGHYPMIENPKEFCDTVRDFLGRVGV